MNPQWERRKSGLYLPPMTPQIPLGSMMAWYPCGKPCSGFTPGLPCGRCTTGTTPSQLLVVISGFENGTCETCDVLNGNYVVTQDPDHPCVYNYYGEVDVCDEGTIWLTFGLVSYPPGYGCSLNTEESNMAFFHTAYSGTIDCSAISDLNIELSYAVNPKCGGDNIECHVSSL